MDKILPNEIIEKVINEDSKEKEIVNSNIDPLTFYKIDGKTIGDIITIFKKKESIKGYTLLEENNSFDVIENVQFKGIIFLKPIEVTYKSLNDGNIKIKIDKNVRSTVQIDEMIKDIGSKKAFFKLNGETFSYFENKGKLSSCEKIVIFYLINPYKLIENNDFITSSEKTISKIKFSKYFNKYFEYVINEKESQFNYYTSEERENLKNNFISLVISDEIKKFKITGPSNDGKSTTLLYLSKLFCNIVYLNLKALNNLYNENNIKSIIEILTYEFGRINFKQDKDKTEFEEIFYNYISQTPWMIIIKLLEYLIKKNISIILILDQFKSSSPFSIIYQNIKNKLNSKFKIVISFSISDNKDFNDIANSLVKNKGNPKELTQDNQDDFFYYANLFDKKEIKELYKANSNNYKLFSLFNFNPKYIYLFDNTSGLNYINNKINNYFQKHSQEVGINNYYIYLFNFSKSIDKEFSRNSNSLLPVINLNICLN